jgi:hypothetical protein
VAGDLTGEVESDSSRAQMEKLLNTTLPDWRKLAESAEAVSQRQEPFGTVEWMEKAMLRSRRGLARGSDYDIWQFEGGLALYVYPGLIQRLFQWLFNLMSKMIAPYYRLKVKIEDSLRQLAARLGVFFSIFGLPLALLGFLGDIAYLVVNFIRSIPSLLLSPLRLLATIATLPFQLMMAFLSRLFWALLLPWIAKVLESTKEYLEKLLKRFPWLRGVLLGFLRRDRPPYPVLIPKQSVNQVLIAKRKGLFGTRTFLVIVEGDPLKIGFTSWIASLIKHTILPFYWERSIHMLCIPGNEQDHLIRTVRAALEKSPQDWK